ncbi:MAG: hypothetical protein JSS49_17100 [Planctomycetes bacterium]|nr:hypothetical protein [Planctomycetota bacterium]
MGDVKGIPFDSSFDLIPQSNLKYQGERPDCAGRREIGLQNVATRVREIDSATSSIPCVTPEMPQFNPGRIITFSQQFKHRQEPSVT